MKAIGGLVTHFKYILAQNMVRQLQNLPRYFLDQVMAHEMRAPGSCNRIYSDGIGGYHFRDKV